MTAEVTVGFLPWWPANPYQILLKRELNRRGIRVVGNPELSLLRLLVQRDGFDVLHVHWPHGLYKTNAQMLRAILTLLAYRVVKNNIVWTVHELDAYESHQPRRDGWFRAMVMRLSRSLIVHGEHTRRELVRDHGYVRRVELARHASYVGYYRDDVTRPQARNRLGLSPDARVFLYFGYIKPYKGVEALIESFSRLSGEDKVLLIAGKPLDDAIAGTIRRLAEFDVRVKLHLGYIADDDIQVFFRAADVVAMPFRQTQTSGSLLLAMSFGCAMIAPRVATVPEYVDESCAILFDPDDPANLQRALERSDQAPLAELGRRARGRAEALTWSDMAAVHDASYRAAMRRT